MKFILLKFSFILSMLSACDPSCSTTGSSATSSNQKSDSSGGGSKNENLDKLKKADIEEKIQKIQANLSSKSVYNIATKSDLEKEIKDLKQELNKISNLEALNTSMQDKLTSIEKKNEAFNTAYDEAKKNVQSTLDENTKEAIKNAEKTILNSTNLLTDTEKKNQMYAFLNIDDSVFNRLVNDANNKKITLENALKTNPNEVDIKKANDELNQVNTSLLNELERLKPLIENALEQAAAQQKAQEQAEQERLAKEQVAARQKAQEQAEQERLAKEQAAARQKAQEQAERQTFNKADIENKAYDKDGKEINIEKEAENKKSLLSKKIRSSLKIPNNINEFKKLISNNDELKTFLDKIDVTTEAEQKLFMETLKQVTDPEELKNAFADIKKKFTQRFKIDNQQIYYYLYDEIYDIPASYNYGLVRLKMAEIAQENHNKANKNLILSLREIMKNNNFDDFNLAVSTDKDTFKILNSKENRKEIYEKVENLYKNINNESYKDYIHSIACSAVDYLFENSNKFTEQDEELLNNLIRNEDIASMVSKSIDNKSKEMIEHIKNHINNNIHSDNFITQLKNSINNINKLKIGIDNKKNNKKISIL